MRRRDKTPTTTISPFVFDIPRRHSSAASAASAATAESFSFLLFRAIPFSKPLEIILSQSHLPSPTTPIIHSVLRSFSNPSFNHHPLLPLRFFVWAALRPSLRLSAASFSDAARTLRLRSLPFSAPLALLDCYRTDSIAVNSKTFNVLLNLSLHAGLPGTTGFDLLSRMPEFGCRPDNISFNTALRLLVRDSQKNDGGLVALQMFDEMLTNGLFPDNVTFVLLAQKLQFEDARKVFHQMLHVGCIPNVVAFTALINGACRYGEIDAAMEILIGMHDHGCRPNAATYTCLIKCLCEKGRMVEAMRLFEEMLVKECPPNRVTIEVLVRNFVSYGREEEACNMIEKLVGEGIVRGEECYSLLSVCLAEAGKAEAAAKLVERMLVAGVSPNGRACDRLVRGLCLEGRFMDGYKWFCTLEEKMAARFDVEVRQRLVEGLWRDGHGDEAERVRGGGSRTGE